VGLLAEKSGDLGRLVGSITQRSFHASVRGDFSTAATLADEALELALREGHPATMALLYMMQLVVRFYLGDLAGAENHFAAGLKFFDDPVFRILTAVLPRPSPGQAGTPGYLGEPMLPASE
jgi:hypothetical protein